MLKFARVALAIVIAATLMFPVIVVQPPGATNQMAPPSSTVPGAYQSQLRSPVPEDTNAMARVEMIDACVRRKANAQK